MKETLEFPLLQAREEQARAGNVDASTPSTTTPREFRLDVESVFAIVLVYLAAMSYMFMLAILLFMAGLSFQLWIKTPTDPNACILFSLSLVNPISGVWMLLSVRRHQDDHYMGNSLDQTATTTATTATSQSIFFFAFRKYFALIFFAFSPSSAIMHAILDSWHFYKKAADGENDHAKTAYLMHEQVLFAINVIVCLVAKKFLESLFVSWSSKNTIACSSFEDHQLSTTTIRGAARRGQTALVNASIV